MKAKFYRVIGIQMLLVFVCGTLGAQDLKYCYQDADGDGYGNPNIYKLTTSILSCGQGWVENNLDCNDNDKFEHPDAVWYQDFDNDKITTGASKIQCTRPAGYKAASELTYATVSCDAPGPSYQRTYLNYRDCNDYVANYGNAWVWLIDNDKDSAVLNFTDVKFTSCPNPPDNLNHYLGAELGGYFEFCKIKVDCNDGDSTQHPGQQWYLDLDGDGYPASVTPLLTQCARPNGYKTLWELKALVLDCNDLDKNSFPRMWDEDKDGDGFITGNTLIACTQPAGYIFLNGGAAFIDCDDTDPKATLIQTWYSDADGDGYGAGAGVQACKGPAGWFRATDLKGGGDCNDNNKLINPAATEICNGVDDDCDGLIDESFCCPVSGIIYVNAKATGLNNGSSWQNAYKYLQDALETLKRCNSVAEIWVAGGNYFPDEGVLLTNNSQTASFAPVKPVKIYGGFAGNETDISQRKLGLYPSILSGEIQQDQDKNNNVYHVVTLNNLTASFVIDGFTIRDGNTSYVNSADISRGTGMNIIGGAPNIRNCYIIQNYASYAPGAYVENSNCIFLNCVIKENTTYINSGTLWVNSGTPSFIHCSIADNDPGSTDKTVVKVSSASPSFVNSIVWGTPTALSGGTPTISYSIVQNPTVWTGTGNLNGNPIFKDEPGGDLQLTVCSPAVNSGNGSYAPTDVTGVTRPVGGVPDMGAFEFVANSTSGRLYVKANATGSNNGNSWANAFTKLTDAIKRASTCNSINEIWVASGTYFPDEGAGVTDNDRNARFSLRNGLAIYGGFLGNETQVTQRNNAQNVTIISGEIQQDGDATNNTFSLFRNNFLDASAVIDGFTITAGASTQNGGAMENGGASPTIRNCIFKGNQATSWGGAIANLSASNPTFINCVFTGNSAGSGAAMFNYGSAPVLMNCTLSGNSSAAGSAIWSQGGSYATLTNCIVWGNTGSNALSTLGVSPFTINNSLTQEVASGTGNLNANPLFVNASTSNFNLLSCSPAINTGTAAGAPVTDIAGNGRPAFGAVDMGAYEKQTVYGNIVYVNANAVGTNNGSSWSNAFVNLQNALQISRQDSCIKQIWVAKGVYKPTSDNSRDSAFIMNNGLAIYGGFAATETLLNQRNISLNATVLSGEIGAAGITDNSFHVISNNANGLAATALLDGFTITGGNANGTGSAAYGGGIYNYNVSPTIANCVFTGNSASASGGGIFNNGSNATVNNCIILQNYSNSSGGGVTNLNGSNAKFSSCVIDANVAAFDGGGVINYSNCAATFINCSISGNSAVYGGGLYNNYTSPATIINCLIAGNKASANGGGLLSNVGSNANVYSCTFNGNVAGSGGAIALYNSSKPTFANSIIWGNSSTIYQDDAASMPVITNSIVQGGFIGTGNLNSDPLFVAPIDPALAPAQYSGNLQLTPCSPAINSGSNASVPAGILTDYAGVPRIAFTTVDMGALERQSGGQTAIIYVDSSATGTGDGSSWANACTNLTSALNILKWCNTATTVQVAAGTYVAPINTSYSFDKLQAIILGGYPKGGGVRNVAANAVYLKGNVQVLKSMTIDGVRVIK